jgi:hypothetical protein
MRTKPSDTNVDAPRKGAGERLDRDKTFVLSPSENDGELGVRKSSAALQP